MNKKNKILVGAFIGVAIIVLAIFAWAIATKKIGLKADIINNPATLALSPSTSNVNLGTNLTVNVLLNTAGARTDVTDVEINYNPTYLQVQDANSSVAGVQIQPGTIYPVYIDNRVDTTAGKIFLSGYINPGDAGITGTNLVFATITFKGLAVTSTASAVSFQFTGQGVTNDCNVVEHTTSNDILASVTNGSYNVVVASPGTPTSLNATSATGAVNLSWTAATAGSYPISGYEVWRRPSGGTSAKIGQTASTTYSDSTVALGTSYLYKIRTYDNQGTPNYSAFTSEVTGSALTPTLTISLDLDKRTNESCSAAAFNIFAVGSRTNPVLTSTVNISSAGAGSVSLTNVPAGAYDMYIKCDSYLSKKAASITVSASGATANFGLLLAGDINNDDIVNTADYSILVGVWNQSSSAADINLDGRVNGLDYSMMITNWNVKGNLTP